jgi:hypothetical protein
VIDEKIRQKIQKLFAMAEGGCGNEAEIALNKAYRFMREYGVTGADVGFATTETPEKRRVKKWRRVLHVLCATSCGVAGVTGRGRFYFMGDEIGVNVARELYLYLKGEIDRKTAASSIGGLRAKNEFRIGIVFGLRERLENGIGWRDMKERQKAVIEKHLSKAKKKTIGAFGILKPDYVEAGKEAAKEISLNRQTGHSGAFCFLGVAEGENEQMRELF